MSPSRLECRRKPARSWLSRSFALLVLVLTLLAQQRLVRAAPATALSIRASLSERVVRVESRALHVLVSMRVERAPLLVRLPPLRLPPLRLPPARLAEPRRTLLVHALEEQRTQLCTHFHAKRRIPRMNSEEPPRALS